MGKKDLSIASQISFIFLTEGQYQAVENSGFLTSVCNLLIYNKALLFVVLMSLLVTVVP